VSSTADAGDGSLRAAIDQANRGCSEPCKIAFEIPAPVPEVGWFTIAPSTPLPPITSPRVFADAKTQTAFTGDTNPAGPEIAIDWRDTASGFGLESRSGCEGIIEGFSIGNAADFGIAMTSDAPCANSTIVDQHRIARNYIGVDPSGTVAAPNQRGVFVDNARGAEVSDNVISGNIFSGLWSWRSNVGVHHNLIGTAADGITPLPNGRSGILIGPLVQSAEVVGNTISFNAEMGVAVARGAKLADIRQNSMRDNGGLGIDIGLDGPNAPVADDRLTQGNPPTLLSAIYDPATKTTAFTFTLSTAPIATFSSAAFIDLYTNDKPDGDGEKFIAEAFVQNANGETSTLTIPGDLRGKWINATTTRVHFEGFAKPSPEYLAGGDATTSEFGNAVLAQ
ncbi:MAG: right-handed parallel beta-helix repeat-containing protein, partial [bacterium]